MRLGKHCYRHRRPVLRDGHGLWAGLAYSHGSKYIEDIVGAHVQL